MLDCIVLGDSLAVGVGQARPVCATLARTGINSAAYLRLLLAHPPPQAECAVISLGVNDDPAVQTPDNLRRLRAALQVRRVTWLLPGLKDGVRQAIQAVAAEHGDRLVDTRPHAGSDHLHPAATGYRLIATLAMEGDTPAPAAARLPAAFHPTVAVNAPRFLPMVSVPAAHPSLRDGFPFRRWLPPGGMVPPQAVAAPARAASALR